MSGGRDWDRNRSRQLVRDRGADDVTDQGIPLSALVGPLKKRKSKAELREEADAAIAEWQRRKGQST
ncbi:hypothetical protein NGM99_12685 [Mesorhizobium sp. RP14(2022)]|uniref:DUF3175 domain-containing protein n=1 Tax=Mesorhizobium liriopis TaxID=2953882 RepID=A0ABT1C741_9HYPH|nr:hypothetical protein [Mesorhizobium liriopis]MCO6050639.1 hypothetical protein [Mesorhizobium liriopis]